VTDKAQTSQYRHRVGAQSSDTESGNAPGRSNSAAWVMEAVSASAVTTLGALLLSNARLQRSWRASSFPLFQGCLAP
jgi:hypothetical protein